MLHEPRPLTNTVIPITQKLAHISAHGKQLKIRRLEVDDSSIPAHMRDFVFTFSDEHSINDLIRELIVVKNNISKSAVSDEQIIDVIAVMHDEIGIRKTARGKNVKGIHNRLYPLKWAMRYKEHHRTHKVEYKRREVSQVLARIEELRTCREATKDNPERGAYRIEIEVLEWTLGMRAQLP